MARHIMAVCVVCLLCADRLPCQRHTVADELFSNALNPSDAATAAAEQHDKLNARVYRSGELTPPAPALLSRRRRHAGGHHTHAPAPSPPELTREFLQRIFDEYGQGGDTLSLGDFQRMLRQMGLLQLIEPQRLGNDQNSSSNNNNNNNNTCIADNLLVQHVQSPASHHDAPHRHVSGSGAGTNSTKCALGLNAVAADAPCPTVEQQHGGANDSWSAAAAYTLTKEDVIHLCPVLLYQLASPAALRRSGCVESALLSEVDNFEIEPLEEEQNIAYVWIYAFISVFACSILGLVGVAIIPFMDSRYYKHIIQFFVSLAVGTMTGDAVLHLLPHSLAGQSERNMIFKGLTCMGGIIFFYMTEHGLTMISEWRKRIAKSGQHKRAPSRGVKVVREPPDMSINNSSMAGGDKLCKSKYSSYPYCYDEIAMDSKADVWVHQPHKVVSVEVAPTAASGAPAAAAASQRIPERKRNGKADVESGGEMAAAQSLLSTSQNHYAPMVDNYHLHQQLNQNHHSNHQQQLAPPQLSASNAIISSDAAAAGTDTAADVADVIMPDGGATINNGTTNHASDSASASNCAPNGDHKPNAPTAPAAAVSDTVMVILREHESSHHGHSHKHGHVHSPPESLSAVAWMIIMGDGLHNFTDGMAIGAAFADNIAGGFSTSLAVFCHELPHELGDFAILIKAGMTVKSAVYYNLLTGVLSFIGMIFGIVFGQAEDTAQWMFAAAAGLFIYIALVDMMPELSSAHKTIPQFVLQILGMASGVLIMLCIALYEDTLMNVFATTNVH